ncbi:MAG: hypothetical protein KGL95_05175, partial [Patescibacteria group bacterium]|nr:hypothetical protein [Patescibacteria group bacterium]
MTSKKLAIVALLGIAMLVLAATPAFAEKNMVQPNSHGGKKHIGAKAYTSINFNDNCGVNQSGWWQAYTYAGSYD